ncbi:hypothetical protein A3J61_01480 [Candidatus Nomurabacteria bacterium RIFCSPHIGHO2_02_FULL_38_15]|uniref:Uncharacterized protein n=1 Tax=Candidatus Nomurabacteria bacterium RIFCSPHIGHO2_02_FULL_38_15 TaxID=1801752 RepID=A0A1F6VQQ7_9BACT|nr:MAG: hypothetical protein A3J61_01480 [Candidatus Nomurabacteria bacterium RIFCSPHIGHO2_02_FULL_38_15]
MKFNFEQIKKMAEIVGVAGLSSMPGNTLDNQQKISSEDLSPPNISRPTAPEKVLNPETTAYFTQDSSESNESIDPLIQKISVLENKFEQGLQSKGVIMPKSLTVIAGAELDGRPETSNATFDDRYLSDQLLSSLVNTAENAKIMLRDLSSIGITNDVKSLSTEGYIDIKDGLKNNKPEYYFVVSKVNNNDSITFVLQVASPINKLVETLDSISIENVDVNLENESFFATKIMPNFLNKINKKIEQFELNKPVN